MGDYYLIGRKLSHSYSPEIHKRLWGGAYGLLELEPEELPQFFARRQFKAINVTIPYKKCTLPYLDEIGETAKRVGSVNTVVKRPDGTLFGDNTDLYGFNSMLAGAGISLAGKHILILGSGGASLTALLSATDAGASAVSVVSRTPQGEGQITYNEAYRRQSTQVIINTTPVGMYPNAGTSPIDLSRFPQLEAAVDMIYNPLRTAFLLQAESLAVKTAGGLQMLVCQGEKAAKLFGVTDVRDGAAVCREMRRDLLNWVLIGMPGSGKTMVGRQLAADSGRPFVDIDDAITERAGMPCNDYLRQYGEDVFRDLEAEVTREICAKTGQVIACGGGTPLRKDNRTALQSNGAVLWLQRDTDKLARSGRPLSENADLASMAAARYPYYALCSDFTAYVDEDWHRLQCAVLSAFRSY